MTASIGQGCKFTRSNGFDRLDCSGQVLGVASGGSSSSEMCDVETVVQASRCGVALRLSGQHADDLRRCRTAAHVSPGTMHHHVHNEAHLQGQHSEMITCN